MNDVIGVKHCKDILFSAPISFIVGDNGTGKSTILEVLGKKLRLPLISGPIGGKGFEAAEILAPHLDIAWHDEYKRGFFFRAEDFSSFLDSTARNDMQLELYYSQFKGEMSDAVIQQMKDSDNQAMRAMNKAYGQDLQAYSHGEAYLQIIQHRINSKGIFLLDEPEAALSPSRQLSLIYFILEHIKNYKAQFIIATHSPMLMAIPGASVFEISEHGMENVAVEETEHFHLTKSFINNPEAYLRHL